MPSSIFQTNAKKPIGADTLPFNDPAGALARAGVD